MSKTLIVDGNNLIHRTYWTAKMQSQRTNKNTPDDISNLHIYFTLNATLSYITKFNPDKIFFVWDEKKEYSKNARKVEYENYKGNRTQDSTPHQNNEAIKTILHAVGIVSIYPRELEADDIVSYLCNEIPGSKVIVSVDKDFIQLIKESVTLYDPIRKIEYTNERFKELTGSDSVEEWLTCKCILGDKSDNVSGIPGYGKAKLQKYLKSSLKLSVDEQVIFDRNMALFRLDRYKESSEEAQYYNQQLQVEHASSWELFIAECTQRNFNTILKKKEKWYTYLFLKNKLNLIFS